MPASGGPGAGPEAERPEYAGQYLLESRLGAGGMGVVHLSRSTSGMRLAIKVVHEELAADPEFRARFRQEVGAARRVSGAFTAPVVDADPDAERPWMATLYIPGPTLAQFVKRNGSVAPAQVRYLMAGLAEALRDIHRVDVVHRDLKPSNVLLAADGPKVIDFGISRPADSDLRTETGKLIGTPPFMAPEQFRHPRSVGPAADVFAMASVLVHAATGQSPFTSDSPYIVAYQVVHEEPQLEGIPADLRPLIERCLAKDPKDRPTPDALMAELRAVSASYDTQTFSAFDLGDFTGGEPIPHRRRRIGDGGAAAPAAKSAEVGGAPPRKSRRRLAVAATAALAVLGSAAALTAQHMGGSPGAVDGQHPRAHGSSPSTTAFAPWQSTLPADGHHAGPAACAHEGEAVFCTRPGIAAARLDASSGRLQWSVPSPDTGRLAGPQPPVLSGGVLRVVTHDGKELTGLDPATGKPVWRQDISAYNGAYYNVGDTVLLLRAGGDVTAVDGVTGRQRWHTALPGGPRPVFASLLDARTAYAVDVSGDGRHTLVSAVNLADGKVREQRRFDGALMPVGISGDTLFLTSTDALTRTDAVVRIDTTDWSAARTPLRLPLSGVQAVVSGTRVYLLEYGGALTALDTGRGSDTAQLWRLETSVSESSQPVVVGDRLYFAAADGRLLAVDTRRGAFLGQTRPRPTKDTGLVAGAPPSPVVADGKVFATAPDGTVFAVDAKDPSRW
ncbi:PQQ-binding-like beta-propeller repeat protein [Streptomyces sp. NPDC088354]|uniref:protein kinase domain-containing protein n=1 Tax=Streptomyces sp. NPDC088354 TaxID=3365856 RepID=UPI00381485F1